jgi:hypothetical protein
MKIEIAPVVYETRQFVSHNDSELSFTLSHISVTT